MILVTLSTFRPWSLVISHNKYEEVDKWADLLSFSKNMLYLCVGLYINTKTFSILLYFPKGITSSPEIKSYNAA